MKYIILTKIEVEVLPKLKNWVNIDYKVTKLTHRDFRSFFNTKISNELRIKGELLLPVKEEEFAIIAKILLYMSQNPDTKTTNDIIVSKDFYKMLEGVIKNA